MELPKMKVYKSGMATFPSELRENGFEGELELTPDACHPNKETKSQF